MIEEKRPRTEEQTGEMETTQGSNYRSGSIALSEETL